MGSSNRRLMALLLVCICFMMMPTVAYAADDTQAVDGNVVVTYKDPVFWLGLGLVALLVLLLIGWGALSFSMPPVFLLIIPTVMLIVWVVKSYLLG